MDDVHAYRPEIYDPHDGIHVGAVSIDKPSLGVHDVGYLADVLFKEAHGIGVGHHDARGLLVHHVADCLCRKDPLFVGTYRHRTIAAKGGARRIRREKVSWGESIVEGLADNPRFDNDVVVVAINLFDAIHVT